MLSATREIQSAAGGVVYHRAVGRKDKALIVLDVVVKLYIRAIPNFLSVAHIGGKFLDNVPVVVGLEFVAVTPEVEEKRVGRIYLFGNKAFRKIHKLG